MLSPFQEKLARLFLGLPEAANFALAGGAALIFWQEIKRTTQDLDFFGPLAEEVRPVVGSFLARLQDEGLQAEIVSSSPAFARIIVHSPEGEEVLVDVGRDYRLRPPEETAIGRVLSLEELAADKLLALFGRAEPRDFVDVFFLARRFGLSAMMEWAKEKDAGFDPYRLALGIGRLESLPRTEFKIDETTFREMLDFYHRLRAELIRRSVSSE
ncbi:MAG: nucleotidyl transferase AbiEii/AbiGii toxin family protein [Firmicutes bacterium]|nr:nucleotidyl transferase AbiEii/AbiGii toxin family protein [Bacillota bacterium]